MRIIRFLARWNELLTIPMALVMWYWSPVVLRWIDPTAATFDAGVLQVCVLVMIQFLLYHGIAWLVMKITFPKVYEYINDAFDIDFKFITEWQRLKVALLLFALYFLGIMLLAKAV